VLITVLMAQRVQTLFCSVSLLLVEVAVGLHNTQVVLVVLVVEQWCDWLNVQVERVLHSPSQV
jgi:hypothetical protein